MTLKKSEILKLLNRIEVLIKDKPEPLSIQLSREYKSSKNRPFILLISCLLSLRARDTVTIGVCHELFKRATTPEELLKIPIKDLEKIVYKLGFYRKKARTIWMVSKELIKNFNGKVPKTEKELLSLTGVGRKTANLVRAEAFNIPAIAVDTHVHRLANKFGLVSTKTPEQTEEELKKIIPKNQWIRTHHLLVACGQNKCEKYIL